MADNRIYQISNINYPLFQQYFVQRLHEKIPTKAEKILNQLKRERGGNLQHRNYAERNQGSTEKWQIAQKLFALHFRRLKFESFEKTEIIEEKSFPVQQKLF